VPKWSKLNRVRPSSMATADVARDRESERHLRVFSDTSERKTNSYVIYKNAKSLQETGIVTGPKPRTYTSRCRRLSAVALSNVYTHRKYIMSILVSSKSYDEPGHRAISPFPSLHRPSLTVTKFTFLPLLFTASTPPDSIQRPRFLH
jgi:hypothetical protein